MRSHQIRIPRLHLRARLSVVLIDLARWLLGIRGPADPGWDTCSLCGMPGCETDSCNHKPDCPSLTGLYVATLKDCWPAGPSYCDGCDTVFWPGEKYTYVTMSEFSEDEDDGLDVRMAVCVSCAANMLTISEKRS